MLLILLLRKAQDRHNGGGAPPSLAVNSLKLWHTTQILQTKSENFLRKFQILKLKKKKCYINPEGFSDCFPDGFTLLDICKRTKENFILGQTNGSTIIVYQAFQDKIADFAVKNQKFGEPEYDFSRMTWIKPNFLWMMYRSGWAEKEF